MKTRSNVNSTTATKCTIPGSRPLRARAKAKPKVTASTISKRKPTSSGSTDTLTTAEAQLLHELKKKKQSTMVVQELAEKTGKTLTTIILRHHVNIPTESRKRAAALLAEEVNKAMMWKIQGQKRIYVVSRKRQKTNSPVISEEDSNDVIDIPQGNQDSDHISPRNLEEEKEELSQQGQDINEDQEGPDADEQDGVDEAF